MSAANTLAAVATAAAMATSSVTSPQVAALDASKAGHVEKYGRYWDPQEHPLTIELRCIKDAEAAKDWRLKAAHTRAAIELLWGKDNEYKTFIFNPWSDRMLEEACKHKYLSIAGCASSGKSLFFACYAIVMWLVDPVHTTVLVTSTSLKESRGRIWADIEDHWNAAQRRFEDALPGKLVSSLGLIKLLDPTKQFDQSERSGIHLVACEQRAEKEAISKMIGFKNKRFVFIGDELPELSAAILQAATSNLDSAEKEFFQLVGTGNPNSIYDPHGVFSKPKAGWKSVHPGIYEWETDLGYCIRFDAEQSPNILAGKVLYKWLPTQTLIDEKRRILGEESLAYWRMIRSFWCATGGSESVVSEADIIGFDCEEHVKQWKDGFQTVFVAFLDPGYTNGGDRSIAYLAKYGVNADNGKWTLDFLEYRALFEDTMNTKVARNFQIAQKFKDLCAEWKVTPDNAGVDDTGAAAFGDIVHTVWSQQVIRVNFGGAPSDLQVSAHEKTLASDKYKNRVTEIWACIREYIRCGQIKGIKPDLGVELTARRMVSKKSGIDLKSQVEPKEKMKMRTNGVSPDIADAALGCLTIVRQKYRFRAAIKVILNAIANAEWAAFLKKKDKLRNLMSSPALNRGGAGHTGQSLDRSV